METDLIQHGVDLMLYGMGTVFAFLTILVFSTSIMSKVVERFFPEAEVPQPSPVVTAASSNAVDNRTLAIIKEAIKQHRAKN